VEKLTRKKVRAADTLKQNAGRSRPLNRSRMAAMEKQYGKEKAKTVYEEMEKKPRIRLSKKK
jgi:hypothetical protein